MSKDPIRLQTEIEYSDHTRINTLMRSDQTRILTDDRYIRSNTTLINKTESTKYEK